METLKVTRNGQQYLLFNLSIEQVHQLEKDSQTLNLYTDHCLQNGRDICIDNEEKSSYSSMNEMPSTSFQTTATQNESGQLMLIPTSLAHPSSSTSNRRGTKFLFLCGKHDFIYGVKMLNYPWHYFNEIDSLKSEHSLLPAQMLDSISRMDDVKTLSVHLNETQSENYFQNGQFVFKNRPLKKHLEIAGKQIGEHVFKQETLKTKAKQLVFGSGETNPLMFLKEFESSKDIKTDKDKMYKILDFVDDNHKGRFAELYFTSDWATIKSSFLKLYTLPFVENKKRELNISFDESESLRSFLERKLSSLSKYTTLPFLNQVEIAINDLPVEVSSLFITEEKMTSSKAGILAFCDKIQNLVNRIFKPTEELPIPNEGAQKLNENAWMENRESVDEDEEIIKPKVNKGRGRGGGVSKGRVEKGSRKECRKKICAKNYSLPSNTSVFAGKKLKPITEDDEDDESTDYAFLDDVSESSQSTWSDMN